MPLSFDVQLQTIYSNPSALCNSSGYALDPACSEFRDGKEKEFHSVEQS
jgi:hypothetical protein